MSQAGTWGEYLARIERAMSQAGNAVETTLYDAQVFGNWQVRFRRKRSLVTFTNDRGQVFAEVEGPESPSSDRLRSCFGSGPPWRTPDEFADQLESLFHQG